MLSFRFKSTDFISLCSSFRACSALFGLIAPMLLAALLAKRARLFISSRADFALASSGLRVFFRLVKARASSVILPWRFGVFTSELVASLNCDRFMFLKLFCSCVRVEFCEKLAF